MPRPPEKCPFCPLYVIPRKSALALDPKASPWGLPKAVMRGTAQELLPCLTPHPSLRDTCLSGVRSDAAGGHGFCPQWQKHQFAARAHHTVVVRITRGSPPEGEGFLASPPYVIPNGKRARRKTRALARERSPCLLSLPRAPRLPLGWKPSSSLASPASIPQKFKNFCGSPI